MSEQVKTIVRILESAGSNARNDGELSLLTHEGALLIENIYNGESLQDQRKVADNVKPGSLAVYTISENKASILFVNDDNILRASEFDPDSEMWEETKLEGLGDLSVDPNSRLATTTLHDISMVFYQGTDGTIKSLILRQAESNIQGWVMGFPIPGDAQSSTPISAFTTDTALHVSFIGKDEYVHIQNRDIQSGEWNETVLQNSSWDGPVTNMLVSQDIETGNFEVFALINTKVDHIEKDGTRSTLGEIVGGKFVPSTKAEAGMIWVNNWGPTNNYFIINNRSCCGCGGYIVPVPCYRRRPFWC
ncbi:hypothetical protein F5B19DRAFT_464342 [Rostrohypoxylon terebratum]|nr:hypothetical protein F5B19DRAFT_464342 [Rostrohypoxylon terebratum]